MAVLIREGQTHWSGEMDSEGHREYTIRWLIESDNGLDGPANVMTCPGLPLPGAWWLVDNDVDIWAWCRFNKKVAPAPGYEEGEPVYWWVLEQTFSTKFTKQESSAGGGGGGGNQQSPDKNPLLEPMKVSGSTVQRQIKGIFDRHDVDILNSAFELIDDPVNEWDDNLSEITIEQNVPDLQLGLVSLLMRRGGVVNSVPMWGVNARCVHLKSWTWSKEFYGFGFVYYKRKFTFQVNEATFDKELLDQGTMALRGQWDMRADSPTFRQYVLAPDIRDDPFAYSNPLNFIKYKDPHGENAKVILNGFGRPYDPGTKTSIETGTGTGPDTEKGRVNIQYYGEANLVVLLGLPAIL